MTFFVARSKLMRTVVSCEIAALSITLMAAAPASAAPTSATPSERKGAIQESSSSTVPDPINFAVFDEARELTVDTPDPVVVPADATWSFEAPDIQVVLPEPEPVPAPEPAAAIPETSNTNQEQTSSEPVSRSNASREEAAPVAASAAPPAAAGSSIIAIASQYVGVPYVSGGTTPAGFDCSGFTSYVYAQAGISLPRTSGDQRYAGTVISADQAQPGDLIWSPGHVAIYAGDGQMIDAPRPGKSVQFRPMWQSDPVFIRVG